MKNGTLLLSWKAAVASRRCCTGASLADRRDGVHWRGALAPPSAAPRAPGEPAEYIAGHHGESEGAMDGTVEAALRAVEGGLTPAGPGWFIVNVAQARGWRSERFGDSVYFEGGERFPEFGINVRRLAPGQASGLYHRESAQEAYLVLSGTAIAVVEGEERLVGAGDFVHLPAGTAHAIVGAGSEPCVILMVGARPENLSGEYPHNRAASNHGVESDTETDDPAVAYADVAPPRPAALDLRL
jgi:uncharacterized cupin superfamily protein